MTEVSSSKPLFFASDSEEEESPAHANGVPLNEASTLAKPTKKRLFFPSSDDENDSGPTGIDDIIKRRAQNASSSSSAFASSPLRLASPTISIRSSSSPVPKKRKVTPLGVKKQTEPMEAPIPLDSMKDSGTDFKPAYIGSFLVPNAWSTCKGRGWVKPGEEICIRRNEGEVASGSWAKSDPTKGKAIKTVRGKQLKLTSMMKVKEKGTGTKPVKNQKPDNVVRFTNSRGFGE